MQAGDRKHGIYKQWPYNLFTDTTAAGHLAFAFVLLVLSEIAMAALPGMIIACPCSGSP